jgi:NADH:ubiquinone oxidoreductase subunit H
MRDLFLLGSTQNHVYAKLTVYSILMSLYLVAATSVESLVSRWQADQLLRSPWVWGITLGVHILLWRAAVWFKRRPIRNGTR